MKDRIIDNYAAVTVGTYLDICKVSRDESLEDLDKQVRILALLYGQTVDEILDLPLADYKVRKEATSYMAVWSWFKKTFPNYAATPELNDDHKIVITPADYLKDDEKSLQAAA